MFESKTCLITGGTGSWGQELTRHLLHQQPTEIRIFSRNEFRQVEMQRTFANHPNVTFRIGDVRDFEAVHKAMEGCDYVFHLAALKHVPICEAQPDEAMKTNIMGTQNVIRASIHHKVQKVMDVSTDKAVNPHNVYGLTKAIGEKLIIHANQLSSATRFVCIRGGNVLGTNGSVVPLFQEQIQQHNEITLTHPDMTRFFLTLADAIHLLLEAAKRVIGGETLVMRMRTCRIRDLAQVLAAHWSTQPVRMRTIGLRDGEKLHEELVSRLEAVRTYVLADNYFVILPPHASQQLRAHYGTLPKVQFALYDSNTQLMTQDEIEQMLAKGGFLP